MTLFNPLAGSLLSSANVQRQLSVDKSRQLKKQLDQTKNAARVNEQSDHQVESPDAILSLNGDQQPEQKKHKQPKRKPASDNSSEQPHLDVKA